MLAGAPLSHALFDCCLSGSWDFPAQEQSMDLPPCLLLNLPHLTLQQSLVCFIWIILHIIEPTALPKLFFSRTRQLPYHNRKIFLSHNFVTRLSLVSETNIPIPDPTFQYLNINFLQLLLSKTDYFGQDTRREQDLKYSNILVCWRWKRIGFGRKENTSCPCGSCGSKA